MRVIGDLNVIRDFTVAAAAIPQAAYDITSEAVGKIADGQRATVPVLTGEVKASIGSDVTLGKSIRGEAGASNFVAKFLQFGTSKMSPKWDAFAAADYGGAQTRWLQDLRDAGADV